MSIFGFDMGQLTMMRMMIIVIYENPRLPIHGRRISGQEKYIWRCLRFQASAVSGFNHLKLQAFHAAITQSQSLDLSQMTLFISFPLSFILSTCYDVREAGPLWLQDSNRWKSISSYKVRMVNYLKTTLLNSTSQKIRQHLLQRAEYS